MSTVMKKIEESWVKSISMTTKSIQSLITAISLWSADLQESPKHIADIALSSVRHQIPWFAILIAAGAAPSNCKIST